ncbi:MAG: hypothetical protein NVS3B14_07920 [Ktedonobacteraceae bacterium]
MSAFSSPAIEDWQSIRSVYLAETISTTSTLWRNLLCPRASSFLSGTELAAQQLYRLEGENSL